MSVPVLSRLFHARGRPPRRARLGRTTAPVARGAGGRLATGREHLAASGAAAARGSSGPAPRANPCPEVTDPFCRLPLSTCSHRPEAADLGDLMRLSARLGESGPRAQAPGCGAARIAPPDVHGPSTVARTPRDVRRSTDLRALSPNESIPRPSGCQEEKKTRPAAAAGDSGFVRVAACRLVPVKEC